MEDDKPSFSRSVLSGMWGNIKGLLAGLTVGTIAGAIIGGIFGGVPGANLGAAIGGSIFASVGALAGTITGVVQSRERGMVSSEKAMEAVKVAVVQGMAIEHQRAAAQEAASTKFQDRLKQERAIQLAQSQQIH